MVDLEVCMSAFSELLVSSKLYSTCDHCHGNTGISSSDNRRTSNGTHHGATDIYCKEESLSSRFHKLRKGES